MGQVLPEPTLSRIVGYSAGHRTRMIKDEVVVQIASNMTADRLQAVHGWPTSSHRRA